MKGVAVLRGVGQIYLQRSALSGALFLAALLVGAWPLGVLAFAGSLVGTLTAMVLRAESKDLDDGLYGFNAALVALAGGVFFTLGPLSLALISLGAVVSTVLFHVAKRRGWSVFTAPFVVVTWALSFLPGPAPEFTPLHQSAEVVLRHFGEVILLPGTWSGALCLLGVFVGARTSGFVALAASVLVFALGLVLPVAPHAFELGLYGFNAVLTAIALHAQRPRWWETLVGALIATLLTAAAIHFGLRALTAPFVLVAWLGTRRRG